VDDDLKRIASRIRQWRDAAGLTLQKLADRSGVSASTIHKIENMQTIPTIAVLLKITNGLNRRPSELLEEVDVRSQVVILRRKERKRLATSDQTELEHLVGMIPRSLLDVWRVFLKPGRGAGRPGTDPWQFQGELVILVEEGCLEVEIGSESDVVETGDSIHFDSSIPHKFVAGRGECATIVVLAMLPEHLHGDLLSRIAESSGDGERITESEAAVPANGIADEREAS
jgi:transcriptional regulator with XRE-family HTH domain